LAVDDDAFAASLLPLAGAGNVVLSPFSMATALQMTLQGAIGNTASQMRSVLHLPVATSGAEGAHDLSASLAKVPMPTRLSVANTIWLQNGLSLRPDFASSMAQDFSAGLKRTDFEHATMQAIADINKTISDQTHGKITNLVGPQTINDNTAMVLANAVYLKAQWNLPFQATLTAPAPFSLSDDSSVSVPTMHQTAGLEYRRADGYQSVTLPYSDGRLAMTIVLPDGSLPSLEKSLTGPSLTAMLVPGPSTEVNLALPKFTFSSSFDLQAPLETLGMTDAFSPELADFSRITSDTGLYVSAVVHKAFIDVDEAGTEAAGATAVVMEPAASMMSTPVSIDRPFLFAITDTTTGAPLFLGNVENPAAS
jgi:serpin B